MSSSARQPAAGGALPEASLPQERAQWLAGDWTALATRDDAGLAAHPERARLAALVGCAALQCGQAERADRLVRQALDWGCDRALVARLLVAGLHNTLGRIAALREDEAGLRQHFGAATAVAEPADPEAARHARAVREMAGLGLLPQAHALLRDDLKGIDEGRVRPGLVAARVEMLRSEIGLLQHELQLAQQRGRPLGPSAQAEAPAAATLRQRSTAQLGQDLWVLERSGYKRDGFFVEFGATDGVRLSNTYLLETEFGWKGICAEPNPRMFEQLARNRRCTVSDACIGARSGERVEFVLAEEYGGFVSHLDRDMHSAKRKAYLADEVNRETFVTESLHDLLTRLGAPRDIDYLSIDTEGSEYEILSTFPFDRWNVRLLTVEHNFTPLRQQIRALLEPLGYRRTEAQWDDWYERID